MRSFADDEIIGFGGNFRSTCTILMREQIKKVSVSGGIAELWAVPHILHWELNSCWITCFILPSICVWMFLCFKRRNSIKKFIAKDTKAPDIHIGIMLHALHWNWQFHIWSSVCLLMNSFSQRGSVHRPKWHKFNTALRNWDWNVHTHLRW